MCRILIVNFIYKLALCLIIYSQSNKSGLCTSLLFPRQKKQTKKKNTKHADRGGSNWCTWCKSTRSTAQQLLMGQNALACKSIDLTQAFSHLFSSCSCSVSAPLHWFKSLDGMLSSSVKQQQLLWIETIIKVHLWTHKMMAVAFDHSQSQALHSPDTSNS